MYIIYIYTLLRGDGDGDGNGRRENVIARLRMEGQYTCMLLYEEIDDSKTRIVGWTNGGECLNISMEPKCKGRVFEIDYLR